MSTPVDSQASGRRFARALLLTPIMLFGHLIATLVFIVFTSTIVPFYEMLFAKHNVEIPSAVISLLYLSHFTVNYWYLMILALIVVDGALLFALKLLPPALAWVRSLWFSLFLLAILIYIGFATIALSAAKGPIVDSYF